MSQPATAAIVVACIFLGIGGSYFSYKIYRKLYWASQRKQRQLEIEALPPIREPFTAYSPHTQALGLHGSVNSAAASTLVSPYSTFSKSNDALNTPAGYDSSKGALGMFDEMTKAPYDRTRNSSQAGSISPNEHPSAPQSPSSPPSAALHGRSSDALSESGGSGLHSRSANGSTSSTMALRKSYAPSVYKGSSTQSIGLPIAGVRRESYLPHNPINRESMLIVPPQPLGFGTANSMAMGTDQKTLAFSKMSGVGVNEDFASGFGWMAPGIDQQASSSSNGASSSSQNGAAAERERYLRHGPSGIGASASGSGSGISRTSSPGAASHRQGPPSRATSRNSHRSQNGSVNAAQPLPFLADDVNKSLPRRPSKAADGSSGGGSLRQHTLANVSVSGSASASGSAFASPPHSPSYSSRYGPYPPSAATFKGLHQFAAQNSSSAGVGGAGAASSSMAPSDSMSTTASAAPSSSGTGAVDGSPIMSPFRLTGLDIGPSATGSVGLPAMAARPSPGIGSISTTGSASASASGAGSGTDTGLQTPSTGPTSYADSSSGRPSRSSGSFRSDGIKAAKEDLERQQAQNGAADGQQHRGSGTESSGKGSDGDGASKAQPSQDAGGAGSYSMIGYGAGLFAQASQRIRTAAGVA